MSMSQLSQLKIVIKGMGYILHYGTVHNTQYYNSGTIGKMQKMLRQLRQSS